MAINIRNARVERLADEIADMTGESRTATILHALGRTPGRIVARTGTETAVGAGTRFPRNRNLAKHPEESYRPPAYKG